MQRTLSVADLDVNVCCAVSSLLCCVVLRIASRPAFAFVCHHQTFLVYDSLEKPEQFGIVTHASVGFSLLTSLTMAITGYLAFVEHTEGAQSNPSGSCFSYHKA